MYMAEIHHLMVHGHATISSHVSQLLLQFDGLYESRSCTFDVCKSDGSSGPMQPHFGKACLRTRLLRRDLFDYEGTKC